MLGLFGPISGFAVGQDARAMSAEEILAHHIKQGTAWQQASPPTSSYLMSMMNWQLPQPPERPLDERFADFKVRLAAAIERRRASIS